MSVRGWWRGAKVAGGIGALGLMAVGGVGSWRYLDARLHPEPAPVPEQARPVGPGRLTPAELRTATLDLTTEERAAFLAAFGLPDQPPAGAATPRNRGVRPSIRKPPGRATLPASEPEPKTGSTHAPFQLGPWPLFLVRAEFGPGPRGDTGEGLCYVEKEGDPVQLRIRWTSPAETLGEAAGCAAAQGAEKAGEVAAAAKEAADQLASKLGQELRLALRVGPSYGIGGPGVLAMARLEGLHTGPLRWEIDGIAWLSADPAVAVAATTGIDKLLVGKGRP